MHMTALIKYGARCLWDKAYQSVCSILSCEAREWEKVYTASLVASTMSCKRIEPEAPAESAVKYTRNTPHLPKQVLKTQCVCTQRVILHLRMAQTTPRLFRSRF